MITFLHLSDLHLTDKDAGTQFDRDVKIRAALLDDLRKQGHKDLDGITVTGDIAFSGKASEYAIARTWFEEIRVATETRPEAFFLVAGNHDVNRGDIPKHSSLWELHQSIRRDGSNVEAREKNLNQKLKDPLFDFMSGMSEFREFAGEYGCPTNPKSVAWVQVLGDGRVLEDGTQIRIHGFNSALISDSEDRERNLLLGTIQFHNLNSDPGYVNLVLCHHPPHYLIDSTHVDDQLRNHAQVVLFGHEHFLRCFRVGETVRLCAGAAQPDRNEPRWEPCYHVVKLSISSDGTRELMVEVQTRVWRETDQAFAPHAQPGGSLTQKEKIVLSAWTPPGPKKHGSTARDISVYSAPGSTVNEESLANDFSTSRRKLIVHFYRMGIIDRYKAAIKADVWEDSFDSLVGQERWAKVFDKAKVENKLGALWGAVSEVDITLKDQANPFNK